MIISYVLIYQKSASCSHGESMLDEDDKSSTADNQSITSDNNIECISPQDGTPGRSKSKKVLNLSLVITVTL